MKFDFVSDMHVEFNQAWEDTPSYDGVSRIYPWHLEKQSDILVLAGDCSNDPFSTLGVVEEARQFYDLVLFTDGNHEHYTGRENKAGTNGNVTTHNNLFKRYMREYPDSTVFLDEGITHTIGGTRFIGCNGWYDWTAHSWTSREQQHLMWKRDSNDSRMIEYDKNGYPDKLAVRHAEHLRQEVIKAQEDGIDELVVITHTIPNRVGMVPDNHSWGYLNGSYMNMLMDSVRIADTNGLIKFWGFGHTHFHCDSVVDGVRYVNNARGYFAHRYMSESGYTGLKQIDTQEVLPQSAFET